MQLLQTVGIRTPQGGRSTLEIISNPTCFEVLLAPPALVGLEVLAHAQRPVTILETLRLVALVES